MVVDDVEDHGQAGGVGGVDEPLEPLRAAVGGLRGRHVDAVVAPAAAARELGHRHQLDRGDAELAQLGQVRDRRLERALGRERADVQLVQHEVAQARAAPSRRRSIRTRQDRAAATARGAPPAASGCTGRASPRRRPRTCSRRPAEPPRGPRRRRSRRRRARGRARRCAATARGRAGPTRAAPRGRRRAGRRRGGARRAGRHQARGPHLPGSHGVQSRPCGCCSPPCSSAAAVAAPTTEPPRTSRRRRATLTGTVDRRRGRLLRVRHHDRVRPDHADGRTSRRGAVTGAGHGPDGRDDLPLPARGRRRPPGNDQTFTTTANPQPPAIANQRSREITPTRDHDRHGERQRQRHHVHDRVGHHHALRQPDRGGLGRERPHAHGRDGAAHRPAPVHALPLAHGGHQRGRHHARARPHVPDRAAARPRSPSGSRAGPCRGAATCASAGA